MNEIPYDPSGRIQQTSHTGYAQLKGKSTGGPDINDGGGAQINKAGILGFLYGLVHFGLCGVSMFYSAITSFLTPDQLSFVRPGAAMGLALAVVGMAYGAGCVVCCIFLFLRKNWSRWVVLVYSGFSALQGLFFLFLIAWIAYVVIIALNEGAAFNDIAVRLWLPFSILVAIMMFFMGFAIVAFKSLLSYGHHFD